MSPSALLYFLVASASKVALPPRVKAAYSGGASAVKLHRAISRGGVNVLLWSFIKFDGSIQSSIDPEIYKRIVKEHPDVVHFVSLGGWNAKHPSPLDASSFVAQLRAWNAEYGFHGLDWDVEGNDDPKSSQNSINSTVLEFIAETSRVLQIEGWLISIVPPQSYLDDSEEFDPQGSVLHSDSWAPLFHYHGRNTYAPLLLTQHTRMVPDMVIVQLYESYSRTWAEYSSSFLASLAKNLTAGWIVDFAGLWGVNKEHVQVPSSALVFGLANWWAKDSEKVFFREARDIPWPDDIRGFAYWSVTSDGAEPYSRDLRPRTVQEQTRKSKKEYGWREERVFI